MSMVPVHKAGTMRFCGCDTITPTLSAHSNNRTHTGTVANKPIGISTIRTVRAATMA